MRYVSAMWERVEGVSGWVKLLGGFAVLFALLQGAAAALQSLRGEWGLVVCAVTVVTAMVLQRLFYAPNWGDAALGLGLSAPAMRGVWTALGASAAALLAYPLFLTTIGGGFSVYANAAWLAVGIFAQAGVAEEIVFRGYLHGHLRPGRSFWRAATLSAIPFAAAHLYLFATMDWPIALMALTIAVAVSFPFAWLYELGGRTIWAPAIAHAVVQGAIKLLVIDAPLFPLVWMAASVLALWLVFLVSSSGDSRS